MDNNNNNGYNDTIYKINIMEGKERRTDLENSNLMKLEKKCKKWNQSYTLKASY